MNRPVDNANQHLSDRLSGALGVRFLTGQNVLAAVADSAEKAQACAGCLANVGVNVRGQGMTVIVEMAALRRAIEAAGGEEAFFSQLAEEAKNAMQENEQPSETRNDQPAQPTEPPRLERDQEAEKDRVKLVDLAEGLQQDRAVVNFREALMQRIELQQRYEPDFDRGKAMAEANRQLRAINKSYDQAKQQAQQRREQDAKRLERLERLSKERELRERDIPVVATRGEVGLAQTENRMDGMEISLKQFLGGYTPIRLQPPAFQGASPRDTLRELNPLQLEDSIDRAIERLGLREPSTTPQSSVMEPVAAMTPQLGRGSELTRFM